MSGGCPIRNGVQGFIILRKILIAANHVLMIARYSVVGIGSASEINGETIESIISPQVGI